MVATKKRASLFPETDLNARDVKIACDLLSHELTIMLEILVAILDTTPLKWLSR